MSRHARMPGRLRTAAIFGVAGAAMLAIATLAGFGDPILRTILVGVAALDLVLAAAVASTA